MITRTAVFEGTVKPGCEAAFKEAVVTRLGPAWKAFPHALDVRLFYMDEADAGAPSVVMMQQIDYPGHAELAEALASPARDAARAATLEVLEMFEGRFYHYVSEGNPIASQTAGVDTAVETSGTR
ncbi:hypothetical protein HT136_17705 [Novosphingobium profundi]|uniref:hypothetical protein n=1 Tax=Novosphingobium profundi TaxID=1774954 RepID=UPI001BDA9F4A|nr:hypothetical protein [Novosphingobium profundi]MBT0670206.1 hypothetical protein [Novosphingobium profundi]